MNKSTKIFMAFMCICLVACTAFSAMNFTTQKNIRDDVTKILNKGTDLAQEDDVLIYDQYTILPTTQISDAYKSGDTSKLSDSDKETLDLAKEVIKKYIKDDMTDYDKELAIYKYLTSEMAPDTSILSVIPDTSSSYYTPHDVLKNKSAVCVGYATTFRMFMQMFDIECKVIHSSDLVHSWNLVKLGDDWYHVDCYMDTDESSYTNFNINDLIKGQSQSWNTEFFPAATGIKYNPAVMNCETITDINSIPKWIKKHADKADSVFSCKFKNKIEDEETARKAKYLVDTSLSTLSNCYEKESDYENELYSNSNWFKDDNGDYILAIYLNFSDSEDDDKLDSKAKKKLDKIIKDIFGTVNSADDYDYDYSYYDDYTYTTIPGKC